MAVENKKLEWDKIGEHLYETGIDHVVIYEYVEGEYTNGEAWNGVTGVTENKSGAEATPLYADNIKYLNLRSLEEYGLTVECYTVPKLFEKFNGMAALIKGVMLGQQARGSFGMSFRTRIGNDLKGDDYGYKLHLVYGCEASPSQESNATVNDSPEAKTMSYEITTTPVSVGDDTFRNTSCVTISSLDFKPETMQMLETELYGSDSAPAKLPLPEKLKELMNEAAA